MKQQDFWMRAASVCIAIGALAVYQTHALQWQQQTEENRQAVAEQTAQQNPTVTYTDGTYSGSGEGFGGTVSVDVSVSGGTISGITITSASGEDAAYLDKAEQIIDAMIQAQSAEVDTVSGATFSSTGIKTAVQQALEGAVET